MLYSIMKIFLHFLAFLVFFLSLNKVFGQSCNGYPGGSVSGGNDLPPYSLCAPTTVSWKVWFYKVDDQGNYGSISFEYVWDDGTTTIVPYGVGAAFVNRKGANWYEANISHIYPDVTTVCLYQPRCYLMVNGTRCSGTYQFTYVYIWDTDNEGSGILRLQDPTGVNIVPICESEPGNVTFQDNSTWNCNISASPDNPNTGQRWIQFVYGTSNNGTYAGRARIPQVSVEGVPVTDASGNLISLLYSPVTAISANGTLAKPIIFPSNVTTNGQVFEITMRYWNTCNPYDDPDIVGLPADLVNGDRPAVTTTALIEIITTPPDLTGVTSNFCIGNTLAVTVNPYLTGGVIKWYANLADVHNPSKVIYASTTHGTTFYPSTDPPLIADRLLNTTPDKKSYWVTETLGSCESDPTEVVVTVRENLPTPGAIQYSKGTKNICPGETITFSELADAPSMTYGGPTQYVWSVTGGTFTGQNTKSISVTASNTPGTLTVSVSLDYVTVPSCNPITVTQNYIINSFPTAILDGDFTYCSTNVDQVTDTDPDITINNSGTTLIPLTIVYTDGTNFFNPSSNPTTGNIVDIPGIKPAIGNITTYTLFSVNDNSNCFAPALNMTGSAVVTVRSALSTPTSITGPTNVCVNGTYTYTISDGNAPIMPVGGQTVYDWSLNSTWATVGGTDNTLNKDMTIVVGSSGATGRQIRAQLKYNSPPACATSIRNSSNINVRILPTAAITGTTTICSGGNTNLTFTFTGYTIGLSYDFSYTDGTTTYNVANKTSPYTLNVNPAISTTYTLLTVKYHSSPLCDGTITGSPAVVTVNPTPTAAILGDSTICNGSTAKITFTLTGVGPFDITYSANGVNQAILENISNGDTLTVNPSLTTTYALVLVQSSNAPVCTATLDPTTVVITVDQPPSVAVAGNDQSTCDPDINLDMDANNPDIGIGTWTLVSKPPFSADPVFDDIHGNNSQVTIISGQWGQYTFQWTTSNGAVCPSKSDQVMLDFGASPTDPDAGSDESTCFPNYTLKGNTPVIGIGTWSKIGGSGTATFDDIHDPLSDVSVSVADTYTFRWTISSGDCPLKTNDVDITFVALPSVVNPTPQVCSDAIEGTTATVNLNDQNSNINNDANLTFTFFTDAGHINPVPDPLFCSVSTGTVIYVVVKDTVTTCENSATITYTVNPTPTANNITPTVCSDATEGNKAFVDLTDWNDDIISPETGYSITWYTANILLLADEVPDDTHYEVSNLQTLYAKVVHGSCQSVATVTFTVNPRPTAIDQFPAAICSDNPNENDAVVNLSDLDDAINGTYSHTVSWYSNSSLSTSITPAGFNAVNGVTYYAKVVSSLGCQDTAIARFTIKTTPNLTNSPLIDTICSNTRHSFLPASLVGGTIFNWTSAPVADITGNTPISSGPITDSLINTADTYKTVLYTITPTASGCTGPDSVYRLTVRPVARITNAILHEQICSGSAFTFAASSNFGAAVYEWDANVNTITGSSLHGNSGTISYTLINSGNSPDSVVYTITPSAGSCPGVPSDFTVVVPNNPIILTHPGSPAVCDGGDATISISPTTATKYTFQWQVDDGFGYVNVSDDPTYDNVLTASLKINNATLSMNGYQYRCRIDSTDTGCSSISNAGILTVNPIPVIQALIVDPVCPEGTITVDPFTINPADNNNITWTNLNGNVHSTPGGTGVYPTGFTAPENFTTNDLVDTISVTTIRFGCSSEAMKFTIKVYPSPQITQIPDTSFCPGLTNIDLANFSDNLVSTETRFKWTNSNTTVWNLGTQGNGYLPVFNAGTNFTGSAITSTVIVLDTSANGCGAVPDTIQLILKPEPVVTAIANKYYCGGETVSAIALTTTLTPEPNAFVWSSLGDPIGQSVGSGTTNLIGSFTAIPNNTAGNYTRNYVVTATKDGCTSSNETFSIIVRPTPILVAVPNDTVCPNQSLWANFQAQITPDSVNWHIYNNDSTGTGNILPFLAEANITNGNKTRLVEVTGWKNSCSSPVMSFNFVIRPTPEVSQIEDTSFCPAETVNVGPFATNPGGGSFEWIASGDNVGLDGSGTGNLPVYVAANNTLVSKTAHVSVIGKLNECESQAMIFSITIKPRPQISPPIQSVVSCPGLEVDVQDFASVPPNADFNWHTFNGSNVGLPPTGSGNILFTALSNTTNSNKTATVYVTAILDGCSSDEANFSITIYPSAVTDTITGQFNVCAQDGLTQAYRADGSTGTPGSLYAWTIINSNPVTETPGLTQINNYAILTFMDSTWQGELQVIETSNHLCPGAPKKKLIKAFEIPTAHAGIDTTICSGSYLVLGDNPSATGGSSLYSYLWSPTQGLSNAFASNPAVSPLLSGIYILQVTDQVSGCRSLPDDISVTVNPKPDRPTAFSQESCFGDPVPMLSASGSNITWYTDSGLSNPISHDNPYNTGENLADEYCYWVTQTVDECESPGQMVCLTIHEIPDAPVSDDTIAVCQDFPVPDLYASGTNVQWFSDAGLTTLAFSGNTFKTNKTAPATYNYWVTQTVNDCQSPATPVVLIIKNKPPQAVATDQSVCYGLPVPPLTATGTNLKWYDNVFLTNQVETGGTLVVDETYPGTYEYYVTQEQNGCTSAPLKVRLIIKPVAQILLVNSESEEYCNTNDGYIQIIASGNNPLQYSISGGTAWSNSGNFPNLGNGSYPVAIKNANDCLTYGETIDLESGEAPDAPQAGTSRQYCEGESMTNLTASAVAGGILVWYSDPGLTDSIGTGTSFPPFNTLGSTDYYVAERVGDCESLGTRVTITVFPVPPAPDISDTAVCTKNAVISLSVSGMDIKWYSDAALSQHVYSGNIFPRDQSVPNIYTYYLTQTENGCTSPVTQITLSVYQTPDKPLCDPVTSCAGDVVPDFVATGTGILWFSDPNLNIQTGTGIHYNTGNTTQGIFTYYVIQSDAHCRSAARSVTQTIYAVPDKPYAQDINICYGDPSPILTSTGYNVKWYKISDPLTVVKTGNSFPDHNSSTTGDHIFLVTQTVNSCESDPDTCILKIKPKPAVPVAENKTGCEGQTIPDLTAIGQNIKWYYNGEFKYAGNSYTHGKTNQGTYPFVVTQTVNYCTSDPKVVSLVINPSPVITNVISQDQSNCDSGDGEITIFATGTGLGFSIDSLFYPSNVFDSLKNGLYPTAVSNSYGCIVSGVTVEIRDGDSLPAPHVERDTVYCSNESLEDLVATPDGSAQVIWYADFGLTDPIAISNAIHPDSVIGTKHYFAVQSVGGCESPVSQVTIVINQQPDPPLSGDTAVCYNQTVPFLEAVGENIQWYTNEQLLNPVGFGNSFDTRKKYPDAYVYYLTQTVNNCQSIPAIDTLTIHELPEIDFSVSPSDEICSGAAVSIYNSSDSVNFYWDFGDGTVDSVYSPVNHLYLNTGSSPKSYLIRLVGTTEFGCTQSLGKPVRVNPVKNFDFTVDPDTTCLPATVRFVSPPGAYSYNWDFGNGFSNNGNNNSPEQNYLNNSATDEIIYTVTLDITTLFGNCTRHYSHNVTVLPRPISSFTVDPPSGGTPFTPLIANNSSGAAFYNWNFGDNTALSIDENPVHTWENPGTNPLNLTVSLTVTNAGGCSNTSSQPIIVYPIPPPPDCPSQVVCEGQPTPDLEASGESGATFRWYDSNLLLTPLPEQGNVFSTGQTDPDEYHYWVTQEMNNVVSLATEVTLTIYPKPEPPVLTDSEICFGEARPYLIATGENVKWYKNITLTTLLAQGDSLYPPDSLPRLNAYLYYATQEENGCTSNYATQRFYINPLPGINWTTAQPESFCNMKDGRIVINAKNEYTPLGFSINGGGSDFNPSDPSTPGTKTYTNLSSGNYPVVVRNKFECYFYGEILVVTAGGAPPAPEVSEDAVYCYGEEINLSAESDPPGDTLIWYSDVLLQNQVGFGTSFEPFVYEDTTLTFYVRSVKGGCPSPASSVTVTIYGIPDPPVVRDTAICFGQDAPVLFVQGQNLQWFADPALTIPISDQQPQNVNVGVHKYYIRQIVNDCISGASELTFTVYQTPPKPIADNTSACYNSSTDLLTATGTTGTIYWSDNRLFSDTLNIGTEFYTGNFNPGQITYYLLEEYVENGHVCRSDYDTVMQTILELPPAPTHNPVDTVCDFDDNPKIIVFGSGSFKWYKHPSTTPISYQSYYTPPGTLPAGTHTYYVTQTIGQCTGPKDTILFTINSRPGKPEVNDVSACFGQDIPDLHAVGLNVKWRGQSYAGMDTTAYGSFFTSHQTAVNTSGYDYNVTQTIGGCESFPKIAKLFIRRSPVIDSVQNLVPFTICNQNNGEIRIFTQDAPVLDNIRYSISNASSFQDSYVFTGLPNGVYIPAASNVFGCIDFGDTVKISDETYIEPPVAGTDATYCQGENYDAMIAHGLPANDSILWYKNSDFTHVIHVGSSYIPEDSIGTTNYYVTQKLGECASDPARIKITINPIPDPPQSVDDSVCFGLPSPVLVALGDTVKWYDIGENYIGSGQTYTPGLLPVGLNKFLVNQTNICTSLYDTVSLLVHPKPVIQFDLLPNMGCSKLQVTIKDSSVTDSHTWYFYDTTLHVAPPLVHEFVNQSNSVRTFQVVLNAETQYGCVNSGQKPVYVKPLKDYNFTANPDTICSGQNVYFFSPPGALYYQWDFGGTIVSAGNYYFYPFVNETDTKIDIEVRLQVTTLDGCISEWYQKTINIYPKPNANFELDLSIGCSSFTPIITNLSEGATEWEWKLDGALLSSSENIQLTIENNYNTNKNYYLSLKVSNVTDNQRCVSEPFTDTITVSPGINAEIGVFGDTTGCSPLPVTFSNRGNGSIWHWEFGQGLPSYNYTPPEHIFTNNSDTISIFNVTLHSVSSFGCSGHDTVTVIVYPVPEVRLGVDKTNFCSPDTVTCSNLSDPGLVYVWNFGDGTQNYSTTDQSDFTYSYSNSNTNQTVVSRQLVLTGKSLNNCTAYDTAIIVVYPEAKAEFLVDTGKCSGQNFHFTNTTNFINEFKWFAENYSWGSTSFNPNNIFINDSQLTDTIIIYLVAMLDDYEFCNDTASKEIYIYPIPEVNYTLTESSGCSPFTVECVNTTPMDLNFQWNFGSGFINQTNDTMNYIYNIGATQPSEKIIVLRGTSQFGCVGTTQQQITVYPEVTAQFTQDKTEGCSPLEIRFTNESTGFDSIAWDFDNGFFSQSQYPIETFRNTSVTDSAVYQVQLIAKTDWCADTAVVTVEVHPAPTVSFFVAPYEDCSPVTIHISDSSQGVSEYFWEFGDQQTSGDPGPEIAHTYPGPLLPTSYNLRLTGENDFGCQASQNQPIYVKPSVNASFVPTDTAGCSPLQVTFQNYSTGNNLTYSWTINNGVAITESSPTRSFVNNGFSDSTLFVQMVARSQYNCLDTASRLIRVYATPNANFTLIPETMLYPQTTVYLLQQTPDSDTITWNYAWNFGDNSSSNLREPQQHVYDTSGMFRVFLRVDGEHCWDSLSRILNITLPPPIAEFDSIPAGCAPHVVPFSNHSIYAHTYRWTFGDGSVSNSRQPEHTYWDAGLYQVKLNIIGPGGIDEQSRYVLVHPKPFARFDVAPEFIYVPEQPVKCFNQSENGDLFEWDFGDGSAIQTDTTPLHYYQQAGEYSIKMVVKTDTDPQCVDSVIREKAVLAENAGVINLPNAFRPSASGPNGGYYSPNGYNNHIFYPPVANSVIEYKLTIFNRWGQKIFETSDITQGWDGYFDGKQCSQDVYVWKVEGKYANKQAFVKMGDVTLIR